MEDILIITKYKIYFTKYQYMYVGILLEKSLKFLYPVSLTILKQWIQSLRKLFTYLLLIIRI